MRKLVQLKDCLIQKKKILEKTTEHLTKVKKSEQLPRMLLNLINIMTDRHSVNDCVDELLEQWKIEIAKVTIDGFDEVDQNEQKIFTSINSLRCSLHFLLCFPDATEKGLLESDKIVDNRSVVSNCRISKSGQSNTTRTIRTVCKAFQKHGSEQAGAMAPFSIHLRNSPVKLTSFCGNRFKVYFGMQHVPFTIRIISIVSLRFTECQITYYEMYRKI